MACRLPFSECRFGRREVRAALALLGAKRILGAR